MSFISDEEFARIAATIPDAPTKPRSMTLPLGLALEPEPEHVPAAGVARNPSKQQAWRAQVDRQFAYLDSVARSALERKTLEDAYQDELKRGPDFTRVRRNSSFNTTKAANRNELDEIMREFVAVDRNTHKADVATAAATGKPFRRTIPSRAEKVLRALIALARRHDAVFPSLARIASMAQCSRRTVCRIMQVLEELGFVRVQRRRKRVRTPIGTRCVQDTNCYVVQHPKASSGFGAMISKLFGQGAKPPASECRSGTAMNPQPAFKSDDHKLIPIRRRKPQSGRLNLWEFEPT